MKPYLLAALLCCITALQAAAQLQPVHTVNGLRFPESIISDGQYLYVSNIGAQFDPLAKDGDGFIAKLDLQGNTVNDQFISGHLHAPKGMAIVKNILYVTDIDTIKGFRLSDGALVYQLGFEKDQVHFLNDLTVKDAHTLFVSATDQGKIFEVRTGEDAGYTALPLNTVIKGANGLAYDAGKQLLYVVSLGADKDPGEIGVIDLTAKPVYKSIGTYKGFLDGVALLPGNRLLFTDWLSLEKPVNATLNTVDIGTGKVTTIANGMQGAADLWYIAATKTAWVPVMAGSKLAAFKL